MFKKVKKPAPAKNGQKQQTSKHHFPAYRNDNASVNPIGQWSCKKTETDTRKTVFAYRRRIQRNSEPLCGAYQFDLCAEGYTEQDLDYILTEVTSTGICRSFERLRDTSDPCVIHLAINLVNETCRLSCFDKDGYSYKSAWIWKDTGVIYAGIRGDENEAMIIEIVLNDQRVRTFHTNELDLVTFIRRFNDKDDREMATALNKVRRSFVENMMTAPVKYSD